jgi:hypothetical protein
MNSFVRKQHKLIYKIKYYANKLLFPISFIDIFKSTICVYTNIQLCDAPKIYNYLNNYNNLIIQSRGHLTKLEEMTEWGLLSDSYILLKIKTEFLIKMINMYITLILRFIRNNNNKNKNKNKNNRKIYNVSYNYLHQEHILLFTKIHKMNNKYILISRNYISSVSTTYIDSLFPRDLYNDDRINYPLYKCDQLDS